MGVFAGPKVVSDGLVLSLDPGNIFKSVDSTSNNFLQNGSFAGGLGVTYEAGSNPTNTIVELENPGDSNYVLRQNGTNTEYQMNIDSAGYGTLLSNTQYVMSGWYATSDDYDGGDTMFHARAYSTGGSHNSTGTGIGTLLYSVEIGGLTWEYRYETITTPSDYSGDFDWYLGYGTTNTTGYRYYTGLKVEQGSFPSLLDLSRNGNDAKVINGTSYSSANGGSLVFDGVDDYMTSTFAFTAGQAVTISGWLYSTESTTTYRNFVDTSTKPMIWWDTAGKIEFDTGSGYRTPSVYRNQWVYVTLVKPSGDTVASYYVNGVFASNGGVSYSVTASTPTWFNRNGGQTWLGNCSNVSIYNRVLTASEIKQNYNATRGRFGI